jgi:hypothetical protein
MRRRTESASSSVLSHSSYFTQFFMFNVRKTSCRRACNLEVMYFLMGAEPKETSEESEGQDK